MPAASAPLRRSGGNSGCQRHAYGIALARKPSTTHRRSRWLKRFPEVAQDADLNPVDSPLIVSPDDLAEVVQALARQKDDVSALLDDPPTMRVTYEQKNVLNNMSAEYAKAQRRKYLKETSQIRTFLAAPENIELLRMYESVVDEFQLKIIAKRKDYQAFDEVMTEERGHLQTQIEADVEKQNSDQESLFSTIRLFFSEIVEDVIDRKALLSVSPNQAGHLEFKAEILDESGNATSADMGHTYRKLLCIAFDMAVLRAHIDDKFPRFVYHDGVFESLDDRKKENLLAVIRRYVELGVQPVITLIDSDLPARTDDEPVFAIDEIILTLHDESEQGRLFKMRAW